ncbi:hypothetical protein G7Y89_g6221 [Cudoniella acicularis]|uniref:DNA-directed RNA polymerase n=1 Tax=Cudoniella acicularis TaxID=354080 RepID=A0A8H4RKW4_9HELO|nr:hypothetical protein G7Y89_g6221 [Cudoniella acicularis]
MLVRAARRRAPLKISRTHFSEQLYLPWLCPAHNPSILDRRRWVTSDSGPQRPDIRRRRNSNDASHAPPRRSMATAVGFVSMDDIPFESFNVQPSGTQHNYIELGPSPSSPAFNTMDLYGRLATSQQKLRGNAQTGVSGDISEVLSVFYACLQVGRVERAGIILRRILSKINIEVDEVVVLHSHYLRTSVEQIILEPSEAAKQAIHKWFELEIRLKGIPFNAEMVAYMLKASLQSTDDTLGGNRKRLVRRYMDMVPGETGLEVLSLKILSAAELNQVNQICPTYNLADGFEESFEFTPKEEEIVLEHSGQRERPIPAVKPVGQKGLGLKALKKALSLFSNLPAQGVATAGMSTKQKRELQTQLEEDCVNSAIDRWREESTSLKKMGLDSTLQTKSLGARMWKWQTALEQYLKDEIKKVDEAESMENRTPENIERCLYGPFLRILPPEKLAAITILSTMTALGAGVDKGLPLSTTILSIAGSVEDESVLASVQEANKKGVWSRETINRLDLATLKRMIKSRGVGSAAKVVNALQKGTLKQEVDKDTEQQRSAHVYTQWPTTTKAKIGAFLMSALINVAKVPVTLENSDTKQEITQLQPALLHTFQYKMGKKYGVIIANKALVEALKREPVHSLLAKHLPMLVQPEPWTLFNKGGFLLHPTKLMRVKLGNNDQRYYAEAAIGQGDLTDLCKGLDVLGKTEWRINQPVFDVMLEAWNSGEAIGNIAPESPKVEIPPEPDSTRDPLERRRWIREVKTIENTKTGLHSQRCFQNFQLEIARALRNESFYFPHNMDFRGRAYPIPPYLNHMGADHCRGLLMFGVGRELGASGLKWLKIHLANVYGFDKASLAEREAFADENISKIYDSATNSLGGTRWWLEAEDPWQCLAACIELKNALESPDPTRFVSHLPVHQDGTCNGLQHYAALGGDLWGAKQVNLEPGDRPADVYSAVAELVKEDIANDLEKGDPCAVFLDGKITRKTVKQTVMTNVYGVTFVGARAQVKKQLLAANLDMPNERQMNPTILSSYVATKIFSALANMFRGAHDIQYWFGECANRVSTSLTPEQMARLEGEWPKLTVSRASPKPRASLTARLEDASAFRSTVIWTTPLNMPVVQPYRSSSSKSVTTTLQTISLSEPHQTHPVNKRKQLQGFPPNFIHSLDATHMLISALRSSEMGLTFAAVHDSFWTHAADIEKMNTVLRDSFIQIHSEDVIGRLGEEFRARYKDCMYLTYVKRDSAVGKQILEWRKKHVEPRTPGAPKKTPKLHELILERTRLRLLASADPKEVEEGQKITTPTAIFAELSADGDLAPDPELKELAMGEIPEDSATKISTAEDTFNAASVEDVEDDFAAVGGEKQPEAEKEHLTPFEKAFTKVKQRREDKIPVWLPLTFPPVPKKGDFDVSRLKDSHYFAKSSSDTNGGIPSSVNLTENVLQGHQLLMMDERRIRQPY